MPNWTQQQSDAINATGRNILVSAAAGSGKTAVLVERVIRMITDPENPVDIDRLLIVTFTNAAAAEMKYRISKSLNNCIKENPGETFYKKQLSALSGAKICTIDAFCANLVREHFYDLSINQDFTVLDESELQLLEDTVINEVLEQFFNEGNKDFMSLIESFTTPNNDKPIIEAVKKLLRFIYAQPFPYYWLENAVEKYNPSTPLSDTIWYSYISSQLETLFDLGIKLVSENLSLAEFEDEKLTVKFKDVFENDLSEFTRFKSAFQNSWDELLNEREATFLRLPSSSKIDAVVADRLKSNREIYKKLLKSDIPSFFIEDSNEYTQDVKTLYSQLGALVSLVKAVDEKLMDEKREKNSYSFSDIEHFAIELLFSLNEKGEIERSELARELSSYFYEILVDEYQDTNEAQDLLFTYLSNGSNLFTVGDIKQSIYRFRLAMPHIFNARKKAYKNYDASDGESSSKIVLDKNFRSRHDICSYVNFIFSNLMSEQLGEIDYNEEEFLNCQAKYEDSDVSSAQINIITGVKGEKTDEKEAEEIAKIIIKKVSSKELIKDGDGYRPVRYGDFAILMRSLKSHIGNYSKVLTEYGIPVLCDNATNLFENNEIKMIMSLLRAVNNPMQDIPLLAVMMSPFYSFSADELAEIKIQANGKSLYTGVFNSNIPKVKEFVAKLSDLKKISVTMSVSAFIRYIVEDTGIISYINAMGNARQRYQNILKLISFAESFEKGVNIGLTAFLRYLDRIEESDKSIDSAPLGSVNQDAVKIMSVHHSKGLEFPICIFAGTNRNYNKSDLNDKLLLNTSMGLGLKCHDEEKMYEYSSIAYAVIKDKNSYELMSENLRVLYVAITRAKEQFISFISCDNLESKIKRLSSNIIDGRINPYLCRKINCDADLLLMCALLHKDAEKLRSFITADINLCESDFHLDINIINDDEREQKSADEIEEIPYDAYIVQAIDDKLNYSYPRKELECMASKLTASSLDSVESGFDYITSAKPSFMNKSAMTAAQRGTAMHTFMQFCSYESAKEDIEKEIERLTELDFITQQQAKSLDREKLSSFFASSLARRMFNSDKIYREIKISSFISARDIYDTDYDDKILVQGIADCVFEENGKLVLLDYKTDRVKTPDELLDRYRRQIMFYKEAISKTLKKPVKEALLYSFYLQDSFSYK